MAVAIEPTQAPREDRHTASLGDGTLLAGRYRVLHRMASGWLAYDERLTRPVLITAIAGDGGPAERLRREVSTGTPLLDALISGGDAFAVRTASAGR
jgi:hypothetical protein